ncbi:MAG: allantoate amidohydrolase [Chitinophagaceae bacterium]
MDDYIQRAGKVLQRINELASISEDDGFITRTYGTRAFIEGRNKVQGWMKETGLQTRVDNIGNLRSRLVSKNPRSKTFVIASHIDTIINAGKFDGPLGVLVGIDLVEQIIRSKIELPFHIELVGFCDEEGCRFHTTYLGSKILSGSFDATTLDIKDAAGISLREAIKNIGGDINGLDKDAIAIEDWAGYFEIHIEQGPVLYEKDIPVGVVTAIAGQCRAGMVFNGEAGHAGTVPMEMRKDALACAAEFIVETEKFAAASKKTLVATIGKLHIINSASNVIPGEVICSLDLRSADQSVLSSSYETLKKIAEDICKKRNIVLEWNLVQQTKPVTCDGRMNELLSQAIREKSYELVELVSGAGHDAVPMSEVSPVAMLFVRCFKGISHNPLENVELKDLVAAIEVSDTFIQLLMKK